jgi:ADP-heptose:LPS heptosyltransferase
VRVSYGHDALRRGSIPRTMSKILPLGRTPFAFDLPPLRRSPVQAERPVAVIRPVTVRSEWRNEARNPRPEYLRWIARQLMDTHHVVVVAHLAQGQEWLEGELPDHHQAFLAGELPVLELLALVAAADLVVGGVGWIVPAAIAARTRAFIVLGGQGGHNAPEKITDPAMDLSRIGWAMPAAYCRCENMRHRCVKTIPNLPAQWSAFIEATQELSQ